MGNSKGMKIVTITMLVGQSQQLMVYEIITHDVGQFMNMDLTYEQMKQQNGCLDNLRFYNSTLEMTILDVISSGSFRFWAFLSFISVFIIVAIRVVHISRYDWFTISQNANNGLLYPYNKHLKLSQIVSHLEFSFIYYSHYQFFHFFYYSLFTPCLGVETQSNGIPIISDSTKFLLGGNSSEFSSSIGCTLGIFGLIHLVFIIHYLLYPLNVSQYFGNKYYVSARFISYFVGCWLICRIGGFLIFQPTFSYDQDSFISSSLGQGDSQAYFGFIPELIEITLFLLDLTIEYSFAYAQSFSERSASLVSLKRKREQPAEILFRRNPIALQSKLNISAQEMMASPSQQGQPNNAASVYSKRQKLPPI